MSSLTLPARVRVSGFILRGEEVALVEFSTEQKGVHYDLPGGGLDPGETLHEGVRRECYEEIGCDVQVGRLLMVGEYVPGRYHGLYGDQHTIDFIFECTLTAGQEPRMPDVPDEAQTGAMWMPVSALLQANFRPEVADLLIRRSRFAGDDILHLDAWRTL
jgi:8-oxo-dGTP pyrophosphatase MutT (NUDIX family)